MTRQLTSLVLFFVPALILNTLRIIVTPLGEMMSVSTSLDVGLHIVAFAIGFFMFKKTRTLRDHEWSRTKAVKAVDGHFKAEEKGIWEKEIHLDSELSAEAKANLKGQVAHLSKVKDVEKEIETEVEIEMLTEAEHVRRAQRRVTGDDVFDEGKIESTIGAVRQKSPMDSLLDWIGKLRGHDKAASRDRVKATKLEARAIEDPVIAQRPIAPIRIVEDVKAEQEIEAGIETIVDPDFESPQEEQKSLSIEEMAYGTPTTQESTQKQTSKPFAAKPGCGTCGAQNSAEEQYCHNCGMGI